MLEAYLRDLESELAKRLPPEDVRARLVEAEAHLTEGVEGRLELGLSVEEAEREAVAAFGVVRTLAQATRPEKVKTRVTLLLGGYALGLFFMAYGFSFLEREPRSIECVLYAWIGLGLLFAVAAFRARRPAIIPVLSAGLIGAVTLWGVVGGTWLDLYPYGGGGVVPPGEADRQLTQAKRMLAERSTDRALLERGLASLRSPSGIESLRVAGGFRAPVVKAYWGYDERVVFTVVPDAEVARTAWISAGRQQRSALETDRLEGTVEAIPMARAEPTWHSLLNCAPNVLLSGVGVAAGATVIDLAFSGLGALVYSLRRRRNGGGLRA